MRQSMDAQAEAFAQRLQHAAQAAGKTSDRSRSGVDVTALAEACGASYEMARRYAEGLAMPKPETVQAMARWLGVSPAWLGYGEGGRDEQEVDLVILEQCIEAVEEAQGIAGTRLSPRRLAPLVAALYREAVGGSAPSPQSVAASIKALT